MEVIEKIFSLMEEQKLEQKKFADSIGVSPQKVSEWKKGTAHSYHKYLAQICRVLGTTPNYLLGFEEETIKNPPDTGGEKERYDKETSEAIAMFVQLDAGDKGVIRGQMIQMLRDRKYLERKELRDA